MQPVSTRLMVKEKRIILFGSGGLHGKIKNKRGRTVWRLLMNSLWGFEHDHQYNIQIYGSSLER